LHVMLTSIDYFANAYASRVNRLIDGKGHGKKIVGTLCLYVPDELIYAAGADRVVLCGGTNITIPIAEEYLPRSVCPLIKSSFGSIVARTCQGVGVAACPHFDLVDMVVGEATCDGKKKMYEIMGDFIATHVIDLPQMPAGPEALSYYAGELKRFKGALEKLTGNTITDERLKAEIRSANETRGLLNRLYEQRKKDPPSISGMDVLKVLQKQYFLSPEEFRHGLHQLVDEVEHAPPIAEHRLPRILLTGCPMASGNTKVPRIIEEKGGVIVVEESCTGTRSFGEMVDERRKPQLTALAERYLRIPCACMTPNARRTEGILELAESFDIDGVVYYTLQFCHGYNIERFRVQQALKRKGIPMLSIETDYGESDSEQIGVRVDAFMEMIS